MPKIYHKLSDFNAQYGEVLPELTVLHKGTFSAEYLYYMMREWLIEHEWVTRKEPDFQETYYEHKETSAGDEVYVRWFFKKESNKGFS